MGYLSERLATTITASLIQWQLRENGGIQGTIDKSIDKTYRDGDKYLFMGGRLTHYSHNEGFWPDHFVMSTNTGQHFYLDSKEQISDASMA